MKTPFEEAPLFYEGIDQVTADRLEAISEEILEVKRVLETKHGLDLSGLRHVKDWMLRSYGNDIADKTSLKTMMNTNKVRTKTLFSTLILDM
jgi:opine dehydrogenase